MTIKLKGVWNLLTTQHFIDQLAILYGNSRDFVFFMKPIWNDFEYVYANESAVEMLGQPILGLTVREATEPDVAKYIIQKYNDSIDNNEQLEFQDYAYFKYSVHKHETTVTPVQYQDEVYILAVTKEIAFERDLQDKYLFMRSVFFKTFLSTVLISNDAKLIEANPKFAESFNLSVDDMRGEKFYELPIFTPESALQVRDYIESAKNGDDFTTKVITFIDYNQEERFYMATFSPVARDEEIAAIFIIFQDVTEYILQQRELKTTMHGLETFKGALNIATEVTLTNLKGEIIEVNDHFIQRTGYQQEELIGRTHNIVNSNFHSPEFFKNLWTTIQAGDIWRGEVRNRTKSGETYWVETTIIPLKNTEGQVYQYMTIHFNVSDKKNMMIDLRNIERTFRLITENTNDYIAVLNAEGKALYSSTSYDRKLGYSEEEMERIQYESLIHPDSIKVWNDMIRNPQNHSKNGNMELKLIAKNGDLIWTEGSYSLVYDSLRNELSQVILVSREITERKEREDSLMFLAYHDSVTQLPNRRYLQREFPEFVDSANASYDSFGVLYIDGDNFKNVNDDHGHDVGDMFLALFGETLLKSVRKKDLVVRLGGDEFLILVSNLSRDEEVLKEEVTRVIEKIRGNIGAGWTINGIDFKPSATIGAAIYPFDGTQLDVLIDVGDRAMYRAKQKQKNSYLIPYFDTLMDKQ